jgi:surfeit locus 1 family protein
MALPAITITDNAQEYQRMTLKGTYDFSKEMQIIGRPFNGKPGIHVITPMKVADKVVLVNRGWSKYDKPYTKPAGELEITGIIRKNPKRNYLNRHTMLDNIPAQNMWFYIDLPQMHHHINTPALNFYVEALATTKPNSYPYALDGKINIYNEHLAYAITWYSLGVALLIMYYFRFYRR